MDKKQKVKELIDAIKADAIKNPEATEPSAYAKELIKELTEIMKGN